MKALKHYPLGILFLSLIAYGSSAQITVDTSHFPHAGENYEVAIDTNPDVALGQASSNAQTWDYTSLQMDSVDTVNYLPPEKTTYGGAFSDAEMAQVASGLGGGGAPGGGGGGQTLSYSYLDKDGDGVKVIGFGAKILGSPLVVPATDKELNYGLPATEGDVFPDNAKYEGKINDNPNDPDTTFKRTVTKLLEVDAFGTMEIPNLGSFDVLRVKDFRVNRDSAFVGGLGGFQIAHDTTVTYRFVTDEPGYGEDLAQVRVEPSTDSILSVTFMKALAPAPSAHFWANDTVYSPQDSIDFFNSSGGNSWNWYFGDGETSTKHQPTHSYDSAGIYTVKLVASGDGGTDSLTREDYIHIWPVSIEETGKIAGDINVYPQPARTRMTMELHSLKKGDYQLRLIGVNGKTVRTRSLTVNGSEERKNIDLSGLSGGTYFYQVIASDGKQARGKVIVE